MPYRIVPVCESRFSQAGSVHAEAWQASHRAFCTEDFLRLHSPERQSAYFRGKLESGCRLFLLEADGPTAVVCITPDCVIEDLYVLPCLQNQGLGTALLRFAVAQCEGTPTLWILDRNTRAKALYEREGFVPTGKANRLTDTLSEIEMIYRGK